VHMHTSDQSTSHVPDHAGPVSDVSQYFRAVRSKFANILLLSKGLLWLSADIQWCAGEPEW
jgi:hypothetical protein